MVSPLGAGDVFMGTLAAGLLAARLATRPTAEAALRAAAQRRRRGLRAARSFD